jgi:phage protein D
MSQPPLINARPDIYLDGEQRSDLQEALSVMVISLPRHGCANAELTLTNWGLDEGQSTPSYLFTDIGLGASVRIAMADPATTLFEGEITGIEEQYGGAAPALTLLLQDPLHHLARHRQSRSYEDFSPDDVIRSIAGDAGLEAEVDVSGLTDTWHQINESDLAFLLRLCARFDIGLRLDRGALRAKPEEPDPVAVVLSPLDSALSVRVLADLNHQYQSSTVQGYSPATAESVDYEADSLSPAPADTSAADTLSRLGWASTDVVPQPLARSQAEAEAYARAHFQRRARQFLTGQIICTGEAGLHSGREITLEGVSPRLAGSYQVGHCTHRFDTRSGFRTQLDVNRAHWSHSQ